MERNSGSVTDEHGDAVCTLCGLVYGPADRCRKCHNAGQRRRRAESGNASRKCSWRSYIVERAGNRTRRRIRQGKLRRGVCEDCQAGAVHAHHDDYRKPDAVRWLCEEHHRRWHRENPAPRLPPKPRGWKPAEEQN